jgi:hypothetical protein
MRKLLALCVALLVSLAIAIPAGAQTIEDEGVQLQANPSAPGRGGDVHGTGAGETILGRIHFALSAHDRGPTGDFGQYSVEVSNLTGAVLVSYKVDLDCVHLHPWPTPPTERGLISGAVTSVTPVPNPLGITVGQRRAAAIQDGGEPSALAPVDTFSDVGPAIIAGPGVCEIFVLGLAPQNVEEGNVNIKLLD